jgi:iron complex transport system ATP-binding protein
MKKAVDITNLRFLYRETPVFTDLSFAVHAGDFFIIIGPNGSGKTTLLKTIAGILSHKAGQINIMGRSIMDYSRKELSSKIAFVPQTIPDDFPFTVTELVLMGRAPYLGMLGVEGEKDYEIAGQAIEFTGVDHLAHRKITELSGGERQRVFIARAICQDPQIMLLDEPTASLDLAHQVRIMGLMKKLKQERGITVVMVSHDINLAAMYGDRLLLIKNGRIVSLGSPEEVLTVETLEKAYECNLLIDENPTGSYPRITLVPGEG